MPSEGTPGGPPNAPAGNTKIANLRSVSRGDLDKLVNKSRHYTADKLSRMYGLPFSEAETLIPALLVYQVLLKSTGAREIIVSNVSMRDGLLLDLAQQAAGSVEESAYAGYNPLGDVDGEKIRRGFETRDTHAANFSAPLR